MNRRHLTRAVLLVLALTVLAALVDGARTWQAHQWNAQITSGQLPPDAAAQPAQLRFAQAHALAQGGAQDAALQRYRDLQDDPGLGVAARYNSANLLMRQAAAVRAGAQPGMAIPLIELAKEGYREVLRANPMHWDARYNLERAQRLLADPDEEEAEPPESRRDAERAATTMRGYSPGQP